MPEARPLYVRAAKHDRFSPAVGSFITVSLPGEMLRVPVRRVLGANRVVFEIDGQPLTRGHTFRKGDIGVANRVSGVLGDQWVCDEPYREPPEPLPPEDPPPRAPRRRVVKGERS